MLQVLHGLEAGHITLGLIFLIFLVFVATPLLKHAMFKRSKGGSAYNPHAQVPRTPAEIREAKRMLKERDPTRARPGRPERTIED